MKSMLLKILFLLINIAITVKLFMMKEYSLSIFSGMLVCYQLYIYITLKFMKTKQYQHFQKRTKISSMAIYFVIIAIVARLINIQLIKGNEYSARVSKQAETLVERKGKRGEILDINGKKLVFNTNAYEIGIDPKKYGENPQAKEALLALKEKGLIKTDLKKLNGEIDALVVKEVKYRLVEKRVDEITKREIDEILKNFKIKSNEIFSTIIPERKYLKTNIYRSVIGNIGYAKDEKGENKIGVFGIEKQYDSYLKEKMLVMQRYFTRKRDLELPTNSQRYEISPNGKNIYLTIDDEINYILNSEMEKQFKATQSEEAHGIVMDPKTGRILALSSFSTLNKSLRNPLFQDQVEPGSTFKPIIIAAAMEEGFINENSKFDVGDGTIKKYNKVIKESSRSTQGILTTEDILKKSSNVGMVLIGDYFQDSLFEEWLKKFGLYDKTGVDFPNELKPYTTPYTKWDKLKKSTMSFGQGIVMTPIQLATAFSAVINGGIMYTPYLVDRIEDENGVVIRRNLPEKKGRVISEDVSEKIRIMLENTVVDGTGKRAMVNGYRVGGKTGTGQLSAPWGGYYKNEYLASFIGFFPVENPQYVILTMFIKPQGTTTSERYGGAVGAPIFSEVIHGITKSKNILSQNIKRMDSVEKSFKILSNGDENEKLSEKMPDLKGLTSKEVLEIFKNSRFKVNISGKGKVKAQIPPPGEELENFDAVEVILN